MESCNVFSFQPGGLTCTFLPTAVLLVINSVFIWDCLNFFYFWRFILPDIRFLVEFFSWAFWRYPLVPSRSFHGFWWEITCWSYWGPSIHDKSPLMLLSRFSVCPRAFDSLVIMYLHCGSFWICSTYSSLTFLDL